MKQYYYLVSSLYDLIFDGGKRVVSIKDFLEFCESQLDENDYLNLKKLFIFNDIKNVINYNKNGDKYLSPSFYSEDEFSECLKDNDEFLPFINEFLYNKKSNKRLFPNFDEIDELTLLFYSDQDFISSKFIRDYFIFELNLRNITTAFMLRKSNLSFTNKIIPLGDCYENLMKNNTSDFGLLSEFSFIEKLISAYDKNDPLETEKIIENIRWDYLDQNTESDYFTANAVFAYTVKLLSVERWFKLSKENGENLLNRLIEQIKGSIKFPNEF